MCVRVHVTGTRVCGLWCCFLVLKSSAGRVDGRAGRAGGAVNGGAVEVSKASGKDAPGTG